MLPPPSSLLTGPGQVGEPGQASQDWQVEKKTTTNTAGLAGAAYSGYLTDKSLINTHIYIKPENYPYLSSYFNLLKLVYINQI